MPLGQDDYDVVIGVTVSDQTAPGAAGVRSNVNKMSDDIRRYGDRQAREFSRTSRDLFNQTDQHATRSASNMVRRLVHIFDTNNFLLRNMARQAGSTTGAIAIGVGKLALSYSKLGRDTEEASHRSKVALQDIMSSVSRLGTDPSAFPAALKATRDLSAAYEGMGRSGHAASIKAGAALEDIVHKRIVALQGGLLKAQSNFEKLRINASKDVDLLRGKINEISASVQNLLGGAPADAQFFKSFIKARTEAEKFDLVNQRLGARVAVAYLSHQKEVEKLAGSFARLESRATRSIKTQSDKLSEASVRVRNYKKEIDLLDKSLVKVAGGTDEAAVATRGFTSSMAAGSIAVGTVLAVILLVIAAAAILTVGMYKGATSAAKYGDEIYKLSLSTGLTVKTLSALSIIARETNTDVDSLAKTFTRTQIQVQRGLDKPFSEAGKALRTLRVNFQELRKANPDQQVFMLAKAFTELNNQNVRATVSQQLFSRDAERQAKMLEQVANGFTIAQQKAKRFGLELDESGAIKAHMATVAVTDLKLAWEGLWVSLGIKILPPLTSLIESLIGVILKSGGAFETFGSVALFVLREVRIRLQQVKEVWDSISVWDPLAPIKLAVGGSRSRATQVIDKEDADRMAEYEKRVIELRKRGLQGDDLYAAGKGPRSNLDRLEDQLKRIRFELMAIQDVGSRQFRLRFELEELQKVKAGFESIFKLRNEMGLTLDQPVPQFRLFGTPEQQRQDLANIQSYVKQMERMKSVFEGVRKVANEQSDALADLARVQQEALMPVVDAGILAEIKYHTAIRDRAIAEKELTADVVAEAKLRKDAIEDEVGSTLKAYMTLQRDLGRSQDTIRDQRAQDEIFLKIIRGDLETEQGIRDSVEERMGSTIAPAVPSELMTIAAHAATIDLNVAAIAEKIGANVRPTVDVNLSSPASDTGYGASRLVRRNPDGTVTVVSEQDLNPDTIKTQTTDPGFLRNRIFNESRTRAGGERSAALRKANQDIIDNQMRMEQSLIDLDTDYLDRYTKMQIARRESARDTVVSTMLLENDLKNLSNVNSVLYKDTWKEADRSRLESHRALKISIIDLQNDIANNGFDQADREFQAHLQSIRDIQEASNEARESIVYNQVRISDATVYHAEIADAAVIDFLANQRSITEVIAEAKVGVIDTTFSAIDSALEKFTSKLGLAGNLVKDLLSGFLRLALSPFFKMLYGSQSGGGGGGGIFGGFPGIGGGGGMGPGGTPPFAGFNAQGLASLLGGTGAASPGATGGGGTWGDFGKVLGFPGSPTSNTAGKLSLGSLISGFAPIAPLLGAGLGAMAGGGSRFGSILGGVGGLAGGLFGAAALSGGFALGAGSLFTSLGLPSIGAFFSTASPLLLTGVGALIAAPLIIGALLLNRNAQRRREETARNQATGDTVSQLWDILRKVQTDQMDGDAARSAIQELHQKWIEFGNTLKDSKTRRHHMETWSHFAPIIGYIETAISEQDSRANIRNRMVPVFGGGGWSNESQLIKVRPGEGIRYPGTNVIHPVFGKDQGYDTEYKYVPKGTRILNRTEMSSATPMQAGGFVGKSNSSELPELHIDSMELNINADGMAEIIITSPHFKRAVIHNVRMGKKEKKIA